MIIQITEQKQVCKNWQQEITWSPILQYSGLHASSPRQLDYYREEPSFQSSAKTEFCKIGTS